MPINKLPNIHRNYKLYRSFQKLINISTTDNYEEYIIDDIKIKIFRAKNKQAIIFLHGGGWSTGSTQTYINTCAKIALELNRTVISIDYRLAPEYPFPTGFNDCYDTINTIVKNYDKYDINLNDLIIMGDSAGANLATSVALKAKKTKEFKIYKQILLYPLVQTDFSKYSPYKSVNEIGDNIFLTRQNIQDYLKLYIADKKDLKSIYVAPLNAKNLFNMPQTLIITAEFDPLRDEGKAYANKLKLYLNDVTYFNVPKTYHGFFNNYLLQKDIDLAFKHIKLFVGDQNE